MVQPIMGRCWAVCAGSLTASMVPYCARRSPRSEAVYLQLAHNHTQKRPIRFWAPQATVKVRWPTMVPGPRVWTPACPRQSISLQQPMAPRTIIRHAAQPAPNRGQGSRGALWWWVLLWVSGHGVEPLLQSLNQRPAFHVSSQESLPCIDISTNIGT